ncbi:Exopolyphosphatase [Coemansia sp. RSA 2703]|nr:Exopolyphosphatase [Coemansia sp. RSA 2703]KAJ2376927.1 Exopolyphosphatase [Coemansia sp. RSA 2607]KAJ2393138.1 Exopolyphosphatase [Coemansia sp. RSA 2603]
MTVSFSSFVKSLAVNTARLSSANPWATGKLTLVLGNESADLDSMVSSISLAYTLTQAGSVPAIPIINAQRSDLSLRPDCNLLLTTTLAASGGSLQDLTFIDDIDLPSVIEKYTPTENYVVPGQLEVWLTDHNAPTSTQMFLEPFVRGIVDHHVDERRCLDAGTRDIEMVGSCASLVARMLREREPLIDPVLAKMLLSPVLIDTANLSPTANKATDVDRAAVAWLMPQVQWALVPATSNDEDADSPVSLDVQNTTELYRALDKLKGQVSDLSARDLLRKDYKQWLVSDHSGLQWNVGISSVGYRLKKWVKRDGQDTIVAAIDQWIDERQLDIALVMTHGKAKQKGVKTYGRDLAVAFSERRMDKSANVTAGLTASDLKLSGFAGLQETERVRFYEQQKIEASRKQVFPVLKGVIESV